MDSKEIPIHWVDMEDPTFEGGSVHTAKAPITNNAEAALDYVCELYLGPSTNKAATSGQQSINIPAGGTVDVTFQITMPVVAADYPVYLDVSSGGTQVLHGQATEDVIIVITPNVSIGTITWG